MIWFLKKNTFFKNAAENREGEMEEGEEETECVWYLFTASLVQEAI